MQNQEDTLPTEHSYAEVAGSTAGVIEEARPPKIDEKQQRPHTPLQPEPQAIPQEVPEDYPRQSSVPDVFNPEEFPTPIEAQEQQEQQVAREEQAERAAAQLERPEQLEEERPEKTQTKPEQLREPRERGQEKRKERKPKQKKPAKETGWDERKPMLGRESKKRIKLEFLTKTTVDQMLQDIQFDKPPQLVLISSESTVQDAFQLLANHKVLSAPVQDPNTKEWLGVIDMFDLLRYVMKLYQAPFEEMTGAKEEAQEEEEGEEEQSSESSSTSSGEEHEGVVFRFMTWFSRFVGIETPLTEREDVQKKKFLGDSIREVLKYSRYPKEITLSQEALIPQVISMFASGLRRIVMMGENKQAANIVSQYDVINYMYKHIEELGGLRELTLKELGIGIGDVYSVREYAEAVQGFYLMDNNHVSAVAVLNEYGQIIANLGVSDLRGLRSENFAALRLPVMEYLKTYASSSTKIPPIVASPTTNFKDLLQMFLNNHVHRVWTVDDDGKLLGVVSLTDVMHVLDESW